MFYIRLFPIISLFAFEYEFEPLIIVYNTENLALAKL
jgi:hypothetical protein